MKVSIAVIFQVVYNNIMFILLLNQRVQIFLFTASSDVANTFSFFNRYLILFSPHSLRLNHLTFQSNYINFTFHSPVHHMAVNVR